MRTCASCGIENRPLYSYCAFCGTLLSSQDNTQSVIEGRSLHLKHPPSAGMAVFLSTVIPGLGQIYLGQIARGMIYLVLSFFLFGAFLYFLSHSVLMLTEVIEGSRAQMQMEFLMGSINLAALLILLLHAIHHAYQKAKTATVSPEIFS